ncbi:hypothetical protein BSL82_03805 [Tardibacter chloracetimidivorans]|uniref:Uncharacterized protein n=1 Tax=Tardibacter chloracetimidivorans TaxID=1921510 RepID=A0A1L3ZSD9_9SPHN|nr:hypothetical protein [Tardibacter chloracetimidivorans]API58542.1 hypothetical protein BSL82_03805 [Tardibacter chloracetimidivorans]
MVETTQQKTTVQVLKEAKQLLIDKGWTQGNYVGLTDEGLYPRNLDEVLCACGHGAVCLAQGDLAFMRIDSPAHKALDAAAGEYFPHFNDRMGQTVEEVLAVFDKAIAAEEAKVSEALTSPAGRIDVI